MSTGHKGKYAANAEGRSSLGFGAKRLLLGRALPTARLEHERLGRPTALAVFSSDNLSSVAYATEEILRVLIPVVGLAAFSLVVPISGVIVLIEAILVFSYRQTIKAYPSAGGAYIVTKDNLGLLPAQLAGVALLVDYVLTVSVSTAAGVQAISTVVDLSVPVRIVIALAFVWVIAYGNLLGVRESGRIFAIPTYVFIGSLFLTIGVGLYQVLTGHVQPFSIEDQVAQGGLSIGTSAVVLFVVLKAFASGGAAVTGVEAISNGVPAFRKPEWRNAQITLMWMGAILGSSFLAVSYLAHRLQVIPVSDESKSVLGQIGQAVYGPGLVGHVFFLLLQISTTLILVLAANTSFADFPRLASFHAGDAFMPRQLTMRGHRLVFSNGIVALAAAASLIIVVFQASVTRMIPLYALGVFTSFTLSQSGMAKRHLRLREKGWKHGLFLNGLGAISTVVVAIIIAVVKFEKGAWVVVLLVPILVFVLTRVNKTYENEEEDLLEGLQQVSRPLPVHHDVVVIVDQLNARTLHALEYAFTIGPQRVRAVHLDADDSAAPLRSAWANAGLRIPLDVIPCPAGDRGRCLTRYVTERRQGNRTVTVVMAGPARASTIERLRLVGGWQSMVASLRDLPDVSVVVVRERSSRAPSPASLAGLHPKPTHRVVILAGRLDRSLLKAIRYAKSIDATEIRAVHAAVDPHAAQDLLERWTEVGHQLGISLDVEECFDRDIVRSVRMSVDRSRDGVSQVTVVLPRRVYPHVLQRLLHDHTARKLAHALGTDADVEVVLVPYRFGAAWTEPTTPSPDGRRDGDGKAEPADRELETEPFPERDGLAPVPAPRR